MNIEDAINILKKHNYIYSLIEVKEHIIRKPDRPIWDTYRIQTDEELIALVQKKIDKGEITINE